MPVLARFLCDLGLVATGAVTVAGLLAAALPLIDGINHFQPVWMALAMATLALALLSGSRPRRRTAGALAMVVACLLAEPELRAVGAPVAAGDGTRVKVMTFNVLWFNRSVAELAAFIRAEQPDIVLLQELSRTNSDALNELVRDIYPHRRFCDYTFRCDGALLTRWPLSYVRETLRTDETPATIAAFVEIGGRPVRVIGTHLMNPRAPSRQQYEADWLAAYIGRPDQPTIVAGDLNLTPWTFTLARLQRRTGLVRHTGTAGSWPAQTRRLPPLFAIDHILSSPHFRLAGIRHGPALGSDHLPVIATLVLP